MNRDTEEGTSSPLHRRQPGSSSLSRRQPESSSLNRNFPPPPSPIRFPGDGLDFRRPTMSTGTSHTQQSPPTATSNIIDLTEEADVPSTNVEESERLAARRRAQRRSALRRAARAHRDGTAERPISLSAPRDPGMRSRSNSPEVEFLHARNVDRPGQMASRTPETHSRPPGAGPRQASNGPYNRALGGVGGFGDWLTITHFQSLITSALNTRRRNFAESDFFLRSHRQPSTQSRRSMTSVLGTVTFSQPDLNFETPAFSLNSQPPAPTYEKPPAPRDGYVRSPGEDDVLICPNCEDELGAGKDDLQRQVWVAKSCGHVWTI